MPHRPRINRWLLPLSWIYGVGVSLRNSLYDSGKLKSHTYPIPVICVGNLVAGGTGKTPMVEHLIRMLLPQYSVAVVSRGYRRKSCGMKIAKPSDSPRVIGDEPAQLIKKFGDKIQMVVDSNRVRAINYLVQQPYSSRPDVILMDDGYQHRSVKPSFAILLSNFNRLMTEDRLLPAGRLREPAHERNRADAVIITKCPILQPIDHSLTERNLNLYPYQDLLFSEVMYDAPLPIFSRDPQPVEISINSVIIAIAGIAQPDEFFDNLKDRYSRVITFPYRDHHSYTHDDLTTWENILTDLQLQHKEVVFVCTDKDAVKIEGLRRWISQDLQHRFLHLPIKVRFKKQGEERLRRRIFQHIATFLSEQSRDTEEVQNTDTNT